MWSSVSMFPEYYSIKGTLTFPGLRTSMISRLKGVMKLSTPRLTKTGVLFRGGGPESPSSSTRERILLSLFGGSESGLVPPSKSFRDPLFFCCWLVSRILFHPSPTVFLDDPSSIRIWCTSGVVPSGSLSLIGCRTPVKNNSCKTF